MYIEPRSIKAVEFIEKDGGYAYKNLRQKLIDIMTSGQGLKIITSESSIVRNATNYVDADIRKREEHVAVLSDPDTIFLNNAFVFDNFFVRYETVSKRVIERTMNEIKKLFHTEIEFQKKAKLIEAKNAEDADRKELEQLLSVQKRIDELQAKLTPTEAPA